MKSPGLEVYPIGLSDKASSEHCNYPFILVVLIY